MNNNIPILSGREQREFPWRARVRWINLLFPLVLWSVAVGFTLVPLQASAGLPAFPGAEGSGALAKGGRGGVVCEVTNLNDSGPGSLRACTEMSGPRTVIFRVSGTIVLKSRIRIRNPYITIAGQTAPGGGIQVTFKEPGTIPNEGSSGPTWNTLLNNEVPTVFRVEAHDVVIRYLRLRPGYIGYCPSCPGTGIADPLIISNASTTSAHHVENIIIDHVSVMWGSNGNLAISDRVGGKRVQNISVQNSIFAEPLYGRPQMVFGASKTQSPTAGDKMTDIDVHRNLLSTSFGRVPLIGNFPGRVRLVNNIFYNTRNTLTRISSDEGVGVKVDIVGNILIARGPVFSSSSRGHYEIGVSRPPAGGDRSTVFTEGNFGDVHGYDNYSMVALTGTSGGGDEGANPAPDEYRRLNPLPNPAIAVRVVSVDELEEHVMSTIGASRRLDCEGNWVLNRDATDTRVVEEYYKNRGQDFLVTHEDEVGGFPVLETGEACVDTSGDGIPDAWLIRNELSPHEPIGSQFHESGYTYLELYLNGVHLNSLPHVAPAAAPSAVSVQ